MSLGKGLLARLHLKVKMYITNLLSGYNLQKISCLKKIFPWPWKLKERFLRFCFFYDLLKLHFFTRCLYFHHSDDEKKEKINSSTIFEEFYLNLKRKFWKFNTQKIELHTKACWRHSKNQTVSLVSSEQNLYIQ